MNGRSHAGWHGSLTGLALGHSFGRSAFCDLTIFDKIRDDSESELSNYLNCRISFRTVEDRCLDSLAPARYEMWGIVSESEFKNYLNCRIEDLMLIDT